MTDRTTIFRVEYSLATAIEMVGCDHGSAFRAGCRCCSINQDIVDSDLEVSWHEEFEGRTRIIFGKAHTRQQRLVLQRLLAFVRCDPEPLTLVGSDKALAKLT